MTRDIIAAIAQTVKLPPEIEWYEVDGTIAFPIRAASGGLEEAFILYLIRPPAEKGDNWYKYAIEVDPDWSTKRLAEEIERSVESFRNSLLEQSAKSSNLDGGDLGRGDNLDK